MRTVGLLLVVLVVEAGCAAQARPRAPLGPGVAAREDGSSAAIGDSRPVELAALGNPNVSDTSRGGASESDAREQPSGTEPFGPDVFHERRERLMKRMKSGVAVLLSAEQVDYEEGARQDADFLYLTGLAYEAGGALLLAPQEMRYRERLFLRPANPERDRWTGYRATLPSRGLEGRTGLSRIERMDKLGPVLSALAAKWHDLHFFGPVVGYQSDVPKVLDMYGKTSGRVVGAHTKDSLGMLARLRMVKEPREIDKIVRATDITVAGHLEAMRRIRPGMHEWELKQIIEDAFRRGGARHLAYGSIVGAGPDGCVLHYPNDDRTIGAGELMLVDAGAELDHYATDVTRTFPASGKFSAEQRAIYQVVLRAQNAALARVRPGVTWDELEQAATRVMIEAGYYDYFIHRLGHFVGLEVHDVGMYDDPIPEGAVITIEPGIYIPVKKIGVRIEDTVVVTHAGARNLSAKIPREPDEIERLMAGAAGGGR